MIRLSLAVLATLAAAADLTPPAQSGKFKYMQISKNRDGVMNGKFIIDKIQQMNLGFSGISNRIVVTSSTCNNCNTQNSIDLSKTDAVMQPDSLRQDNYYFTHNANLIVDDVKVQGHIFNDTVSLVLTEGALDFKAELFMIENATLKFRSNSDGDFGFEYIGEGDSLLEQLVQQKIIDNPIISFYTQAHGGKSYVKFGSMDMNAL